MTCHKNFPTDFENLSGLLFVDYRSIFRWGVLRTPAGKPPSLLGCSPLPCVRSMFYDFSDKNITLLPVLFFNKRELSFLL